MTSLFDTLGDAIRRELAHQRDSLPLELLYHPEAARMLAERLRSDLRGRRATLIADARTQGVAGEATLRALRASGFACEVVVLGDPEGGGSPACDDRTHDRYQDALPAADVLVAVGSGVVNDLTKWLAADAGLPYAVMATAASMNGYAAANVAPAIQGVKSLIRARAPRFIAAVPSVIEAAPYELTSAGLGDVIAKPVSTADWVMNRLLFQEPYSQAVADAIRDLEPRYLSHPGALAARHPDAVQALFEALVGSGCAMTLQGTSVPASGGEHLISHTLDMTAHVRGHPHDLHGRQVGVATIFAAALYERVLGLESPRLQPDSAPFDPAVWRGIAGAVEVEHNKKVVRTAQACESLARPGAWESLRAALVPILKSPGELKQCLSAAGAAHTLEAIGCTRGQFLEAVVHGGAIRGRFTSLDLGWVTGVLPLAAQEIVDAWLV